MDSFKLPTIRTILLVFLLPLIPLHSQAQPTQTEKDYREFLINLGFDDYAASIKENRLATPNLTPLANEVMVNSEMSYQAFTEARELAVTLMIGFIPKAAQTGARNKLIDFTARMMKYSPQSPPSTLPKEIMDLKGEEFEAKSVEYVSRLMKKQVDQDIRALSADFIDVLIGEEQLDEILTKHKNNVALSPTEETTIRTAADAQVRISKLVTRAYWDPEMGRTKYLGRALALCIHKYALENNADEMTRLLDKAATKQGLYLENFVGSTVVFPDRSGKPKRLVLKTGDAIMERSVGQEAGQITFAARPGFGNWFRAAHLRLMGCPLQSSGERNHGHYAG